MNKVKEGIDNRRQREERNNERSNPSHIALSTGNRKVNRKAMYGWDVIEMREALFTTFLFIAGHVHQTQGRGNGREKGHLSPLFVSSSCRSMVRRKATRQREMMDGFSLFTIISVHLGTTSPKSHPIYSFLLSHSPSCL